MSYRVADKHYMLVLTWGYAEILPDRVIVIAEGAMDKVQNDPRVIEYFLGAYEQWIGQGADAFRIDTIPWMPHDFWHKFTTRIREKHPGFFMFGEAFDYDANKIAEHTLPENAGVSVTVQSLSRSALEISQVPCISFASSEGCVPCAQTPAGSAMTAPRNATIRKFSMRQ